VTLDHVVLWWTPEFPAFVPVQGPRPARGNPEPERT
jgi:hypothetical protein